MTWKNIYTQIKRKYTSEFMRPCTVTQKRKFNNKCQHRKRNILREWSDKGLKQKKMSKNITKRKKK